MVERNSINTNITFDKSVKKDILALLGKDINEDNLIVEKTDLEQKVLTFEGEEISLEEFGGIQKGSEVFIKNNLVSLIKLSKKV
ncbi:MAG: hypothetical protein KAT28_03085 [Candidatus Aenigmarchaeota archaeon]|nr:hypothetical protein [Candidatus Aenigmarchaeota archaeon]